ncbi:MAG TPA: hypothetical protein ENI22_01440 [Candidatus Pacearchaeota archaeon]|nr:hypothetical protein [Candidatus Pacearchaeota archaeon]
MTFEKIKSEVEEGYWDENKDPKLEAIFIAVNPGQGQYKSMLYTLEKDGEEVKVWGSKVLDERMLKVEPGQRILIEFLGSVQGKEGSYKKYEVSIWKEPESEKKDE